jgi:hypothetical protein
LDECLRAKRRLVQRERVSSREEIRLAQDGLRETENEGKKRGEPVFVQRERACVKLVSDKIISKKLNQRRRNGIGVHRDTRQVGIGADSCSDCTAHPRWIVRYCYVQGTAPWYSFLLGWRSMQEGVCAGRCEPLTLCSPLRRLALYQIHTENVTHYGGPLQKSLVALNMHVVRNS